MWACYGYFLRYEYSPKVFFRKLQPKIVAFPDCSLSLETVDFSSYQIDNIILSAYTFYKDIISSLHFQVKHFI